MQTIGRGLRAQLSHMSKTQSRRTALQQIQSDLPHPLTRCHSTGVQRPSFFHRPSIKQSIKLPPHQQQQHRLSSFLHDESVIPNKRQTQKTVARESYFTRRLREKEARSKISTLALTRDAIPFETETALEAQNESQTQSQSSSSQEAQDSKSQTQSSMTPRRRRLLLIAGILLLPVIGGDLVEAVLPGLLGVIIFVAGNIKAGVKWVKSIGSGGH